MGGRTYGFAIFERREWPVLERLDSHQIRAAMKRLGVLNWWDRSARRRGRARLVAALGPAGGVGMDWRAWG